MKKDIFSLKGKVTIVTGGNQGIGKVVAGYLADAGSDVVIFDLNDATKDMVSAQLLMYAM